MGVGGDVDGNRDESGFGVEVWAGGKVRARMAVKIEVWMGVGVRSRRGWGYMNTYVDPISPGHAQGYS